MVPIIIGDSHGFVMAHSYGQLPVLQGGPIKIPLEVKNDGVLVADYFMLGGKSQFNSIDEAFLDAILAAEHRWSYCALLIHGNDHNINFMLAGDRPFDFLDPTMPCAFVAGRQIIPRSVVLDFWRRHKPYVIQELQDLKGVLRDIEVIFIAPPPPIPSNEHIRSHPEVFNLTNAEINDPLVRLKIYRVYVEALLDACGESNTRVVTAPNQCIDSSGFLKEAFWNGCTHASPAYYKEIVSVIGKT
jgi:hypothetical protein